MSECASDCMDTVDPRVQIELERLNTSTDDINKLEVDLDEARLIFRQLLYESTFKIQSLAKKLGGCIDKSRPYYEARFKANVALQEMRAAAVLFEKANSAHSAAREMVYLAEQGLCRLCDERQSTDSGTSGVPLDPAWQEMLNHATARVNQSEAERGTAGARHRVTAERHRVAQAVARQLQISLKRHIAKSRPYFEEKARYNALLDTQKTRIQELEREVSAAKLSYGQALRNLEKISDEIHRLRSKCSEHGHPKVNGEEAMKPSEQTSSKTSSPESAKVINGLKNIKSVENLTSPDAKKDHLSKADSIREWIKQNGSAKAVRIQEDDAASVGGDFKKQNAEKLAVIRPKSLPQDFSDKYSDILTPFQQNAPSKISLAPQNKGSASTPSTVSKNGPESDNWIEINLEYSSPEEISFEKCSNFSSLECYRQIPYERMTADEEHKDESVPKLHDSPVEIDEDKTPSLNSKTVDFENIVENKQIPNSKVSADSPRRIIRNRLVAQKSLPSNSLQYPPNSEGTNNDPGQNNDKTGSSLKSKLRPDIANWISRSSAKDEDLQQFSPTRRQSFDVLLNDTGEKMKEIFSQGFMMFHISSLTDRRNSEPRGPLTDKLSPTQAGPEQLGATLDQQMRGTPGRGTVRKMPSPLDKTLSYLNACNENGFTGTNSDDQGSDTDSLASVEMLTDDQIHSLMLDNHLEAVCQQLLGSASNGKAEETVG